MNTATTVDHTTTVALDGDAYLPCTRCGQTWRLFTRALPTPYALPVKPPNPVHPAYTATGSPVNLYTTPDDGRCLTVTTSWSCTCGALHYYDTPTTVRVECECGRAALERRKPDDYYTNPRYGMACSCCGLTGVHILPRGQVATWQCRRSW